MHRDVHRSVSPGFSLFLNHGTDHFCITGGPARVTSSAVQVNQRELAELRAQVEELHNHSATIEKESQFYFGKVSRVPAMLDPYD